MSIRAFTEFVVYKTRNIQKADNILLRINDSYAECVTTTFLWPARIAHEPYCYLWTEWSYNNIGPNVRNTKIF